MSEPRPRPTPTVESAPWWASLRAHAMLLQACDRCARVRHYPRPRCPHCHAAETRWIPATGRGVVASWTVAHHAFHPAFAAALPYTLVTVTLEEGVRMVAPWRGENEVLCPGLPVVLCYEDIDSELTLPAFGPDEPRENIP